MAIEFPGKVALLPNAFFIDQVPNIEEEQATRGILAVEKYFVPVDIKVVEYVIDLAQGVFNGNSNGSMLTSILSELPRPMLQKIVERDEETIELLRRFTNAPSKEGSLANTENLGLTYGKIPDELTTALQATGPTKLRDYWCYFDSSSLHENGFGQQWVLRLKLTNGALPDRSLVDLLIGEEGIDTITITADGAHNMDDVKKAVKDVYGTFPGQMPLVVDTSAQQMSMFALQSIAGLNYLIGRTLYQLTVESKEYRSVETEDFSVPDDVPN